MSETPLPPPNLVTHRAGLPAPLALDSEPLATGIDHLLPGVVSQSEVVAGSKTDQLSEAIGGAAILEAQKMADYKSVSELVNRSPQWLTDGLDENKLKQIQFGKHERYCHVDLSDNPIETGYPIGDLVNILQVGQRNAYVWRLEGEEGSTQFTLTDDSFELGEDGALNGWWEPLEAGTQISITNKIGDGHEGDFDIMLIEHAKGYEMAMRNRGDLSSRSIRAESTDEIEERTLLEQQRILQEKTLQEHNARYELLMSQRFDNFVDFSNYESFLVTSVEHYLRTPQRTGNDDLGAKYVEVHTGKDGGTYIIPAPRPMRPYGATTSGHHSIVDELRVYDGDNYPNYMRFVDSLEIDTSTVRSKGYLVLDEEGKLVLELNQNRGTYAEREDFKWFDNASRDAKKAGINRVVLDDFSTKGKVEIDLTDKIERRISFSPQFELFTDPNLQSNSLLVGVVEELDLGKEKYVKSMGDKNYEVTKLREIRMEGREANLKLHGPLIEKIAKNRDGFKDTQYPIVVHTDEGDEVRFALTYQFDRDYAECGMSFRYETQPPLNFEVLQKTLGDAVLENIAMKFHNTEDIHVSIATSVGEAGKPTVQVAQIKNPNYFKR